MIRYWCTHYEVSERRACAVAMCSRSLYRYESRRDSRTELRARIREIAQARVRYGYRRVHVLLGREGWKANHKLVYRLYQGVRFRALTVVDIFTKECLAIEIGQSLKGEHVVAVLKCIAREPRETSAGRRFLLPHIVNCS